MTDNPDKNDPAVTESLKYFYRVMEFFPLKPHIPKECMLCNPELATPRFPDKLALIIGEITKQHLSAPKKIINEMKQQIIDLQGTPQEYDRESIETIMAAPTQELARAYESGDRAVRLAIADHLKIHWDYMVRRIFTQHSPFLKKLPGQPLRPDSRQEAGDAVGTRIFQIIDDLIANRTIDANPEIASTSNTIEFWGVTDTMMHEARPVRLTLSAFETLMLRDAKIRDYDYVRSTFDNPYNRKIIRQLFDHLHLPTHYESPKKQTNIENLLNTPLGSDYIDSARETFKMLYGREMTSEDPVFFDAQAPKPTAITTARIIEMTVSNAEQLGFNPATILLSMASLHPDRQEAQLFETRGYEELFKRYHITTDFRKDPGFKLLSLTPDDALDGMPLEPETRKIIEQGGIKILFHDHSMLPETKNSLCKSPAFAGIHEAKKGTVIYIFRDKANAR